MSFIETIEIKNFKSIRHQKIEGCKKINVFIGYPNVGKSNILEALSNFSVNGSVDSYTDFVRVGKSTTLFFDGNIEDSAQVILNDYYRIKLNYTKYGIHGSYQLDRFQKGFSKVDSEIKNANVISISDLRDQLFGIGDFDVSEQGLKIANFNASNELRIFEESITDLALATEYRKIPLLKYEFKKEIKYESKDAWQLKYPFGQNIFEIISTKSDLSNEVIELFKSYDLNFVYDSESQEYKILKMLGNKIFTVPYSMVADTLHRLIFYMAAIKSNKNSILIFEEPEAQMFPPYIRKFTAEIIFDKTNQFFLATHSPYVLDELILEAGDDLSVYLVDYKGGETIIHPLGNDDLSEIRQYGVDLFFNIESYLKHGQVNNS